VLAAAKTANAGISRDPSAVPTQARAPVHALFSPVWRQQTGQRESANKVSPPDEHAYTFG
jgi:hypothetical protein